MSHTERKRSCAFKWFSTRVSAVQLSLCDRMFVGSEKKMERGGEGCFFFNDIDPKPLTIHPTRPLGTESEWDGLTCCSVSTSSNGKPASVSLVSMTSKRAPTVSVSSTNLKKLPVYRANVCVCVDKIRISAGRKVCVDKIRISAAWLAHMAA